MSLSNTQYALWPGVQAHKVGRFRSNLTGAHFYGIDTNEIGAVCNDAAWELNPSTPNGLAHAFRASATAFAGGTPVYRFRNANLGSYFLTTSEAERQYVANAPGWFDEGVAFHVPSDPSVGMIVSGSQSVYPPVCETKLPGNNTKECRLVPGPNTGLVPVYRFFSHTRGHFYTADYAEASFFKENAANNGYAYEGVGFWAFAPQVIDNPALPSWITGSYYNY